MRQTDQMLDRFSAELEERQTFIDGIVEAAQTAGRDLTPQEMELVTRTQERLGEINGQMQPLIESRRITDESRGRLAEIARLTGDPDRRPPAAIEYRSAGEYAIDMWRSGLGDRDARERLELYTRAAAHQTTADNPGLLPETILGPVLSFVDASRPTVNLLGPRSLPGGSWSRPTVTQHTKVQPQSGEKTELTSQKMIINKVPVAPETYGGYVNVSRQDIDWTQPGIMDLIINDLAGQYAKETENAMIDKIVADATAGPTLPTGAPTQATLSAAVWTAVATVYAATFGQGQVVIITGTDMLGQIGPLFSPVNPTNAQGSGFSAANFGTGLVGNIGGIPVYVSAGCAPNTMVVLSTVAAECYEDRVGALQVVEPSVLGVQVAYAGYFARLTLAPQAIIKIVKTP